MKNENKLDQFFKTGLSDPQLPFNELDWDKMASLLDSQKRKRIVPLWLYTISGVAAALIVVILWSISDTGQLRSKKITKIAKIIVKPSLHEEQKNQMELTKVVKHLSPVAIPSAKHLAEGQTKHFSIAIDPVQEIVAVNKVGVTTSAIVTSPDIITTALQNAETITAIHAEEKASFKLTNNDNKGQLSLTLIAAPDISTVSAGLHSRLSSNFGVLANYSLSRRFSVTTGVVYAKKYYDYAGVNKGLYGKADKAWEVDADCDVMDIPLNVNYKVLNRNNLSISINTGLSSYLMLKEKYKYLNQDQTGTKISSLVIDNKNQHLFGVANFSVSFEHKINQRLSVGVQPFYKIPLTGIGYHDSNLSSKGLAFSLTVIPFKP
ncbi:hypothetical protein ACVWYN_002038 [Pedobacter sp. UYP24]